MENSKGELTSSLLGTLEYWDNAYSQEIKNFDDHGDVGEVWFGKVSSIKIIRYIISELKLSMATDRVIDLGCGNGVTLVELSKAGFRKLTGVDYSQKAIELARRIVDEAGLERIELYAHDVVESARLPAGAEAGFRLAHDKGTYDAVSLDPENSRTKRERYIRNVHGILLDGGWLALTSCNWTRDELIEQFADFFEFVHEIPGKTFAFGGQTGSRVTQIIFRKI